MGLLDLLGAMTNSNRVSGGIQTMPDGSFSYSPMNVSRPGWDMVTGGRGTARANAYNDTVLATLLQQQMANKARLAEIEAGGGQTRETNKQMAGFNEAIVKLQADVNKAQAELQAKLNQQNELASIAAQGGQTRETNQQAANLNKEIMQLQADINEKSARLQQNLSEASKMGVTVRSDQDLDVMAREMNDPNIQNVSRRNRMEANVLTSPEGVIAHKQGMVGSMQAPAIKNVVDARFLIPPANIATTPSMDKSGLVTMPQVTGQQFGLTPFAEQVQQMMQMPDGTQYPVGERLQTSGYRVPVTPKPRPPQLKQPSFSMNQGGATGNTISTMPDMSGITGGPGGLANIIAGGFPTGSPGTSFYGGMPAMSSDDYTSGLSGMPSTADLMQLAQRGGKMATDMYNNARIPDWLRHILGWETGR